MCLCTSECLCVKLRGQLLWRLLSPSTVRARKRRRAGVSFQVGNAHLRFQDTAKFLFVPGVSSTPLSRVSGGGMRASEWVVWGCWKEGKVLKQCLNRLSSRAFVLSLLLSSEAIQGHWLQGFFSWLPCWLKTVVGCTLELVQQLCSCHVCHLLVTWHCSSHHLLT